MSNRKSYPTTRTYRFPFDLAKKLKATAFSFKITEADLVRLILETGIELMLDEKNV